jgi:hypothetical protein
VDWTGNNVDVGAVGTSIGFYVGLDGETTIGLQRNDAIDLAAYGDNVNCVFMGGFLHIIVFNKPGEVILASTPTLLFQQNIRNTYSSYARDMLIASLLS